MANTLTTLEYAGIIDGNGATLSSAGYAVTSSDLGVATIGAQGGFPIVIAQAAGTATIAATRNADGATADFELTVTASGDTFTIALGTPAPK